MSNRIKPHYLTLSVLAAMSAQSAYASEINQSLATAFGYASDDQDMIARSGGSAVFDEFNDELATAYLLEQATDNQRLLAQSNRLTDSVDRGFQPLHIEGTLSSIYDYVPLADQGVQLAQVELPPVDSIAKIIYANSEYDDYAQEALKSSSIVKANNPYAQMSTDEAVALLEAKQSGAVVATSSKIAVTDAQPQGTHQALKNAQALQKTFGYAKTPEPARAVLTGMDAEAGLLDGQRAFITATADTQSIVASASVPQTADTVDAATNQGVTANESALEVARQSQSQSAAPATQATAVPASRPTAPVQTAPEKQTVSMVPPKKVRADEVLKQQEGDASSEKNLEEVFSASEKRYSLLKQGNWGVNYDARYSYYRDSRVDIATRENSSDILRFRIEEDAQHTLTNSFNVQYGLKDNLTLSADLPIIAKTDLLKDASTVNLGDITLGARWEPFPLEKDRLPLTFNANATIPTGVSPYEIDRQKGLSTGRGYYGIGGGVSTRKYIDPVVLFGSASLNYGFQRNDIDQSLGGDKTLIGIRPNLGAGIALGFAYSLNYDVSLTMSYQQSFSVGSEFTVRQAVTKDNKLTITDVTNSSADQTSALLNMALGIRVSPKTIVNTSIGIGLTEDTPDVSFGVSFPLDFAGLGKK